MHTDTFQSGAVNRAPHLKLLFEHVYRFINQFILLVFCMINSRGLALESSVF